MSWLLRLAPILLLSALLAGGCTRATYVSVDPPPPREEVQTAAPSRTHVWVPGHWQWQRGQYIWKAGHWTNSKGRHWVPGHWDHTRRGWVWREGHWSR